MSEDKMSSDEVPQKFVEWLLSMGCPPDKVASVDEIAEMCRGQYYMVWRSLIEHVEPKDSIRSKRLQVFCDDIKKFQKRNVFNKFHSNVVVPDKLSKWKEQADLNEKVVDIENRNIEAQGSLNQLMDKVSSKLSLRNVARRRVADAQRREWLLRHVADELRTKRDNLRETRAIADSLCVVEDTADIENKLDKCLSIPRRQLARQPSTSLVSVASSVASSSIASTHSENNDYDDALVSLVKRSGSALLAPLGGRRAALAHALPATHAHTPAAHTARASPQSVMSQTTALHCSLALDAMKHRSHVKHTQARLAAALTELTNYLSGEACELLVVRCEHARSEARVNALRMAVDDLTSRRGAFEAAGDGGGDRNAVIKQVAAIDRDIESKREELMRLITCLAITERKIQNVRECLISVFNAFQSDSPLHDRFGGQLPLPQESISVLRQYYEEEREKRKNKTELSLNLDVSGNCSFMDPTANGSPTFVDELKIYLKKFSLENNRKLILESGEKIRIDETLQSSADRLHSRWHSDDVNCSLVCPSVSLALNLTRLVSDVQAREGLEEKTKDLDSWSRKDIAVDITSTIEEEEKTMDNIKKRLNENLLSLQKTTKTLQLGQENLQLWADNEMKKYISTNRTLDGKTYREYEMYYVDSLNM